MALPRTFTVADLYAMPESEQGERQELIDGALVVNPAPTWRHQLISSKLNFYLTAHVMANQLGWVNSAPGLHIDDRTYVIPDVVYISRERGSIVGAVNIEAAPDLACEILSPSTRRHDVLTKRALYARIGVREYWVIDPDALTIVVLALEEGRFIDLPQIATGMVSSRILPDLQLRLADLFEDMSQATTGPLVRE